MEKELVHFNRWHSPENGQFISGPGGASSSGSIFQRRKQKKAMEKAKKAEAERWAKCLLQKKPPKPEEEKLNMKQIKRKLSKAEILDKYQNIHQSFLMKS